MPFDYKKEYRAFYQPPKVPAIIDVPEMGQRVAQAHQPLQVGHVQIGDHVPLAAAAQGFTKGDPVGDVVNQKAAVQHRLQVGLHRGSGLCPHPDQPRYPIQPRHDALLLG